MLKIRSYFIVFAVAFAISTAYAMIGIQDAKAQAADSGAAYTDLIKRIEALEANGTGNVTAGDITGLKIGFEVRHRYEQREQFPIGLGAAHSVSTSSDTLRRTLDYSYVAGSGGGITSPAERSREVDTEFTLQRVRLYFDADINKNVRGYIKLQDSRTFGAEQSTVGNLSRTDLLEGYAELRNLGDLNPILGNIGIRVGRWQASYGNDRLIGHLNWTNQARAYDGGRVRWDNKKNAWVDVFAFQVQENNTAGVSGDVGVVNSGAATAATVSEIGWLPNITGRRDEVLYGVYSQFKIYAGNVFEPYFLARARSNDINTTSLTLPGSTEQRYTVGFRLDGKDVPGLGGLDYTVEPAWQFGKADYVQTTLGGLLPGVNYSSPIQAFAVYAGGGYTFKNIPWTPRIGYAYAFASGDERPNSGGAKTFDHLYPTGHAQLGYIDFVAWQNIKNHQIHLSFKPTKKLGIDVKGHIFSLDEEADSWYNVAGGTGVVSAAGVATGFGGGMGIIRQGADAVTVNGVTSRVDDELGQEIDLTVNYNLFKNFGVVAGYSHFFAGDFVEDTGAGMDRGSDWAYLQTTLSF